MYRIERVAGLSHLKLRALLQDLQVLGFTDGGLTISKRGYAFLSDLSNKVVPVLSKYNLWDGRL